MAAATEAKDERRTDRIANDLAALHAERGDHADAVKYLRQAPTVAQRIGDRWMVAQTIGNAVELYLDR